MNRVYQEGVTDQQNPPRYLLHVHYLALNPSVEHSYDTQPNKLNFRFFTNPLNIKK